MGKRKEDEANADPSPASEGDASAAAGSDSPEAKGESRAIEPTISGLPAVESPKLAEPDSVLADETDTASANSTIAATERRGRWRFALLAASIALVAALGSFVGAFGASGLARLVPGASPAANPAAQQTVSHLAAEVLALKANIEAASRTTNAQFAKLADRLDRAERAQAEPLAKIARIAEAVDRLEKRAANAAAAAPETTGSITAPPASPAAAPAMEPKLTDRVIEGWVVHDVREGRALVESRYGGVFAIAAGGFLPGVGRVQQIKRQDGRWVVVTARGLITSYH